MKTFLTTLCLLALASLACAKPTKGEARVSLSAGDTLYVQIIDSVGLSYANRDNRFREMKDTVEEIFAKADFPMAVEVVKFGANRVPQGQPRLDLTIMRWGDNGFGEIEARFSASLKSEYDRDALGVFLERGGSATIGSSDRQKRAYNEVLGKALAEMLAELNLRLPMGPPEDEAEAEIPPESNPYLMPGLLDAEKE